ncbi:class C sortase [Faecalicatena contorta]|nr:class C sortase [Faecalicatena contorta]
MAVNREKGNGCRGGLSVVVFIIIFTIGALILFYPKISSWYLKRIQRSAVQSYEYQVAGLSAEERIQLWEEAVEYNERLAGSVVKDPFASIDEIDPFDKYYTTLDIGSGMMGNIYIPEADIFLPIYHGVSNEVLDKGVGHIPASALPVGGEGTHSILTGHSGLPSTEMFNDLEKMKTGDVFYLKILNQTLAYQVYAIETILPDNISRLKREEGKDLATLITCTPYGINTHRLLVMGERIEYLDNTYTFENEKTAFPWWSVFLVIGLLVILLATGKLLQRKKYMKTTTRGIKR